MKRTDVESAARQDTNIVMLKSINVLHATVRRTDARRKVKVAVKRDIS